MPTSTASVRTATVEADGCADDTVVSAVCERVERSPLVRVTLAAALTATEPVPVLLRADRVEDGMAKGKGDWALVAAAAGVLRCGESSSASIILASSFSASSSSTACSSSALPSSSSSSSSLNSLKSESSSSPPIAILNLANVRSRALAVAPAPDSREELRSPSRTCLSLTTLERGFLLSRLERRSGESASAVLRRRLPSATTDGADCERDSAPLRFAATSAASSTGHDVGPV